jgi:invasion protein IalB
MRRQANSLLATIACGATLLGLPLARSQTPTLAPRLAQSPAAAPTITPVSPEPQSTTATFGDWVLRCEREAARDQPQRICEVAQTLEVKGQGVVAQIALRRLAPKEPMRMTIVLPPNISLRSGVRLSISDKDENPVELEWKRCLPGGCVAEGDVREDLLRSWRAQTGTGQIRYVLASAQQLGLSFSFRGLAVALDNLAKSPAAQ